MPENTEILESVVAKMMLPECVEYVYFECRGEICGILYFIGKTLSH